MKITRWIITGCLLLLGMQTGTYPQAAPTPKPEPTQLTFAESGAPRYLDPQVAGDVVSSRHVMNVYETLLEYAPFGECRLHPCLAKELPTYDSEKLSYTFKLRDDAAFADDPCFPEGHGRKVTAADVVFALKRLAALPSGGFWVIEGKVKGLDAFRAGAVELVKTIKHKDGSSERVFTPEWWKHMKEDVAGLEALDDSTLRITLNEPYPQFLMAITLSYGAVVPIEAAKKYDLNKHMVGTGPYMLKEATDELLRYERNPNYRAVRLRDVPEGHPLRRYEGARLPLTDQLRYEIVPEDDDSFQMFLDGTLPVSGMSQPQFQRMIDLDARKAGKHGDELLKQEYRDKGIRLRDYLEPTVHYISFNMYDPVVGTPAGKKGAALRKAVAMSVNREEYIEKLLDGRGAPAHQLVPPGVLGRDDACKLTNQKYDPAAARKLLKDAGYTVTEDNGTWSAMDAGTGQQITFEICFRSTSESTKEYGKWLVNAVAKVGIKLVPKYGTFSEFLKLQDEGKGQAYDAGWVMDYPDAQNMLQLLYGPNKPPGINSACYASDKYDALYEKMVVLRDDVPEQLKTKHKLIIDMHQQIDKDTPWVLMEYRKIYTLYHKGWLAPPPNPFAYNFSKYDRWDR
jgi:ABC-type transport system substrate-binding protein